MTDIVPAHVRSRMMAGIKGKNTKPELVIRSGLHRIGFRFRLHGGDLPGRPDLILPKRRAVIFINGCFWHGHNCGLFRLPGTRTQFWKDKIDANRARDARSIRSLRKDEWRIATVWECALRGPGRIRAEAMLKRLSGWLMSDRGRIDIRGRAYT